MLRKRDEITWLLTVKGDLSSVRLVQSAAGATTKPIIQAIYDKFPNAVLNYGWGQSESGAGSSLKITRAMLEADSPLLESVGRPMKHVEMKVVDEDGNEVPDGEVGRLCSGRGR